MAKRQVIQQQLDGLPADPYHAIMKTPSHTGFEIAIIGMAGRFSNAPDLRSFGHYLQSDGSTSATVSEVISFLEISDHDAHSFDTSFFDLSPQQAANMESSHRLFLEEAWKALEHAGHDPVRLAEGVGVYAGVDPRSSRGALNQQPSEKPSRDLALVVSERLGLVGPAITVKSKTSSLLAVHLAIQALLSGECDLALAGGVAIERDPEGREVEAGGGVVVLRRLEEALEGDETVHGWILGSIVGNGAGGHREEDRFAAHTQMVRAVHRVGEIEAESIGYVEVSPGQHRERILHALHQAFVPASEKPGFCALGLTEVGNVGSPNVVTGIAALIKAVLICREGRLPPAFERTENETELLGGVLDPDVGWRCWDSIHARRAAVAVSGETGVLAYLVVEQALASSATTESEENARLWVLSAPTETGLESLRDRMIGALENQKSRPADLAYTLQVGRRTFRHRLHAVARNLEEARSILRGAIPREAEEHAEVQFLLSGVGIHRAQLTEAIRNAPVFRQEIERCRDALGFLMRENPLELSGDQWKAPSLAQPAHFAIEYAWARQWIAWGIQPSAMLGSGLGEWVAACLAGVFQLGDALRLAVMRGRLLQQQPVGVSLSIKASLTEIEPWLESSEELRISAFESWGVVVSGSRAETEKLSSRLREAGVDHNLQQGARILLAPALDVMERSLRASLGTIQLNPPQLPFLSGPTGTWILPEQATDPEYWAEHWRQPQRFSEGLQGALESSRSLVLEVGPGKSGLRQRPEHFDLESRWISPWPESETQPSDGRILLEALGRLWGAGMEPFWSAIQAPARRVPLPSYPFERRSLTVSSCQSQCPLDLSLVEHLGTSQLGRIFAQLERLEDPGSESSS